MKNMSQECDKQHSWTAGDLREKLTDFFAPTSSTYHKQTYRMNTYKLRAETYNDADGFVTYMKEERLIPMENVIIERLYLTNITKDFKLPIPDCTLTFTTNVSIDEIKRLLRCFPDTHVMLDTLALITEYTGKR